MDPWNGRKRLQGSEGGDAEGSSHRGGLAPGAMGMWRRSRTEKHPAKVLAIKWRHVQGEGGTEWTTCVQKHPAELLAINGRLQQQVPAAGPPALGLWLLRVERGVFRQHLRRRHAEETGARAQRLHPHPLHSVLIVATGSGFVLDLTWMHDGSIPAAKGT